MTPDAEALKLAERLEKLAFHGPTMEAVHLKDPRWMAATLIRSLITERDTLTARIAELDKHVEELQEKIDPEHGCACSDDRLPT